MKKVSIVIPSRNEIFVKNTVEDLLLKARGEIEIIVILDGYWPDPMPKEDPRVKYIHKGTAGGMRSGINDAVAISSGNYIMKIDAHCMVSEGFDLELIKGMTKNDQVFIPRRKRLDAENWTIQDVGKPDVDYEYLSFPDDPNAFGGKSFNGTIDTKRILDRRDNPKYNIDEDMSFQGSCWFMTKKYFYQLELMDEEHYGPFWSEAQEIGFKCFLSGGSVMINKNVWYAHLHKGKVYGRMYPLSKRTVDQGAMFSIGWLNNNAWPKQTLPFHTMIDRFMPIPGWPENWEELLNYDREAANAKFNV